MIVVFGSINIDVVMRVERLPAPGETVLGGDYTVVPGGKGANQACAAARAGGDGAVAMIGMVGPDPWGDLALGGLSEAGVDLRAVARARSPTGCAIICVDASGENAIAAAGGANLEAEAARVPDRMLEPGHWLVLQMEVPPEENWRLIERARRRGCKVLLNLAPALPVPEAALNGIDVLVFNEVEGRMLAGDTAPEGRDPAQVARRLRDNHGLTAVATLGAAGAVAFAPEGAWRIAAPPVTPVDTTGAGDGFVGALVASLATEAPLPAAIRRASVAAGICCEAPGAQAGFPGAGRIEARLGELEPARRLP